MIEFVHRVVGAIVGLLMSPLEILPPTWQLLAISALAGVGLLAIYGLVSNQARIRAVKRSIYASLLEALLFRHDFRTSMKAQARMLKDGAVYFLLAVPPLLILAIPCILLLAQLNVRFGYRPLVPGESTLVAVQVSDSALLNAMTLAVDEGKVLSSPALRDAESSTVYWKLTPQQSQQESEQKSQSVVQFTVSSPSTEIRAVLAAGANIREIQPVMTTAWWEALLFPQSAPLPPGIQAVHFSYPEQSYKILGIEMHWVVIFFLVSLLAGLAGSKFLRVEI